MWESLDTILHGVDAENNLEPYFISIVMLNLCNFCIMEAILHFMASEREEKMAPYFYLMLKSHSNRIRRVFAFNKKIHKFIFRDK